MCSTGLRPLLWVEEAAEYWYRQNVLCFVAAARRDLVERALRGGGQPSVEPLNIVHPHFYLRLQREFAQRGRYVHELERRVQERRSETEILRAELATIKNSRSWRLCQAMRPVVATARRVGSMLRIGPRHEVGAADGPN